MNIEEVPKVIEELSKEIDRLTYALLFAGICPRCGAKIKEVDTKIGPEKTDGLRFVCTKSCGLQYLLSNKATSNIKHGKDVTAGE